MKYAVVEIKLAMAKGINHKNKVKSKDKTLMLMNENELKLYGDAETVAIELGGKLVGRQGLNKILISRRWNR